MFFDQESCSGRGVFSKKISCRQQKKGRLLVSILSNNSIIVIVLGTLDCQYIRKRNHISDLITIVDKLDGPCNCLILNRLLSALLLSRLINISYISWMTASHISLVGFPHQSQLF